MLLNNGINIVTWELDQFDDNQCMLYNMVLGIWLKLKNSKVFVIINDYLQIHGILYNKIIQWIYLQITYTLAIEN